MKKVTILLGGQDREFHFGLGFLGVFLEASGLQLSSVNTKILENPFKYVPLLMYHSAAFALKRKGQEVTFDEYDMAEWVDDINGVEAITFLNAFRVSLVKDVPPATEPQTEAEGK